MRSRIKGRYDPITDLQIEQYLCDDLPEADREKVEEAAAKNSGLATHIKERRAEREAFYFAHPRFPQELARGRTSRFSNSWVWALGAAALASLALLVAVPMLNTESAWGPGDPNQIRARGDLKAILTVKRDGSVWRYRAGEPLYEGDRVRITVESPRAGYLTVLGRDSDGEFFVLYDSLKTTPGSYTVSDSLVLDDHVGEEEWLILLTPQKKSAGGYVEAWSDGRDLGADATSLTLRKLKKSLAP